MILMNWIYFTQWKKVTVNVMKEQKIKTKSITRSVYCVTKSRVFRNYSLPHTNKVFERIKRLIDFNNKNTI